MLAGAACSCHTLTLSICTVGPWFLGRANTLGMMLTVASGAHLADAVLQQKGHERSALDRLLFCVAKARHLRSG